MSLVHEFEKFVYYGLEELPVGLEESRVLSDNVHNIGGNNGLVVLSSLHFHQT
jgi:hypothetical protein